MTIGMEVHVELETESKMFCSCKNGMGLEGSPNKNICPICTGQPGAIPVPNKKAVDYVIKAGKAMHCRIARNTKFDRKNYFYPDLPKGFQISQDNQPLCTNGFIEVQFPDTDREIEFKKVRINRIHLEEDTGKITQREGKKGVLIDFNRSGVPLMELVTEPDIKSAKGARLFCEELQLMLRYMRISSADMEKGQMRCEANVSLYKYKEDRLSGTKVELKNLNSFKAVEKAVEYEIKRQSGVLSEGEKVRQETRGWDDKSGKTYVQRVKEDANDYRYFPEPDIMSMRFTDEYIDLIRRSLREMPYAKRRRFAKQYGLIRENINILVSDRNLAGYFEEVCSELENWMVKIKKEKFSKEGIVDVYRLACNYIVTELKKHLIKNNTKIEELKITPEDFAELIRLVYDGVINSSTTQAVMAIMFENGRDPERIIRDRNLAQDSDEGTLRKVAEKVIAANPGAAQDYKDGKENALKFLMGQVMKETQGKANPKMAVVILRGVMNKG